MKSPTGRLPEEQSLEPGALAALQRKKLQAMLGTVLGSNAFYQAKLQHVDFDPLTDPLHHLPLTTRREIEADQLASPPYGTNLTFPLSAYMRMHQTSGTSGKPVRWLDTADSWAWFGKCWRIIYSAAGITPEDRLMFPFSFGPFIGFWAAFESSLAMGCLTLAAGGMTTSARLRMILENKITVIGCTPTYALRMAEVAAEEKIDLGSSRVRALIVAGEPGGSIPAVRDKIEAAWNHARVFDHTGMTEIGSLGFECKEAPGGIHLIETECIPEIIDPQSLQALKEGEEGELVLTNLGRVGSPLIRYRTGDRASLRREKCKCGRYFARVEGGLQGRIDDMIVIRGNNVFPSALEALLRQVPGVGEFQIEVIESGALTQIHIKVEAAAHADAGALGPAIRQRLQDALHFQSQVEVVPQYTLPRFEMKSKRVFRRK